MLTPQRKGWSGWSLSPRAGRAEVLAKSKGKAVAVGDEVVLPPPNASLGENGVDGMGGGGDAGDWRSFRDAGFLDKSRMQIRDREALVERISELEKELHEYQYNMGLLLIEKKEWSSKFEEMRQGLTTAEEFLKREQAAHLNAVSEFEKREENMRKALGVEKQCVADLEKALREMRTETAEVKFTSDKKLADAHALEASIEEKRLEIEGKLRSADAKLAETSRKSAEMDRKLEDVEARERKVQRELASLNAERKGHDKDLVEQREYLQDWEKKLQEGQKRLVDGQRFLNEREDRASQTERILKKKEEDIDEARKMIEVSKNSLEDRENDINLRLRALSAKEKDADVKMEHLAKKEMDLLVKEENLVAREKVGIQKQLDDHKATLDLKRKDFDFEMEQKRKSFDEEMKSKLDALEKEKEGLKRKENEVVKREHTLENKMERLKMKEKDLDMKSKALKKWEDSIKDDEKKLKEEKKQLEVDKQEMVTSIAGLERLRTVVETEKHQIVIEKESLKLTKEEREQHLLLQSKLKQEIEEYRRLKETLVKESEALRQERERFENDWEVLDEKKTALEADQKQVADERLRFEKWRLNEEERLKNEGLEVRLRIQREVEELHLKKEAFESTMEHERLEAHEAAKRDHADVDRELELRKHELEMKMQKRQEEMEKMLQEREADFDKKKEMEVTRIKSSSSLIETEIRKLKMEQERIEREKEQLSTQRQKLETDQHEIQKDIDSLRMLSRNLKDRREEFVKEREHFLALAEQFKICKNCGVPIGELEILGFQQTTEIEDAGNVPFRSLADGYLEECFRGKSTGASPLGTGSQSVNSGGHMSWLQKCSKLFNFSPGKGAEKSADKQPEKPFSFRAQLDQEASDSDADLEIAPYEIANDSFDTHRLPFDSEAREPDLSKELHKAGCETENSGGIADNSVDIMRSQSDDVIGRMVNEPIIPSAEEQKEMESSLPPENDSLPQQSKQRRRQPSRKSKPKAMKRTRSVLAVVEDAKAILGESSQMDEQFNGDAIDSLNAHEESQEDSVHANQVTVSTRQKRHRTYTDRMTTNELDAEESEARSESVSLGGRRKRRQIAAPGTQPTGEKRYNLRRSTIVGTAVAAQATSDQTKGFLAKEQHSHGDEIFSGDVNGEGTSKGTSKHNDAIAQSVFATENRETRNLLQKTNIESVSEVQEISSQKIVRFEKEEAHVESDGNLVIKSLEFSEESGEDGDEVDGATGTEAATPSAAEYGSDNDDEDEEDSEKHNASISKKLWTFFTS